MSVEWVYLDTQGAGTDEVYGRYRHTAACGTEVEILQGHAPGACPKCHPEAWPARLVKD